MAEPETVPRFWRTLDDEQRAAADEITRRALAMWQEADGDLSIADAVDLAASQVRHHVLDGTP